MFKLQKKAQALEEIKILKRTKQPYILFLLETMTNEKNTRNTIQKMCFDLFDYVLPINHSRGIWMLWNNNNNRHASILAKENCAIHMLVHDPIGIVKISSFMEFTGPLRHGPKIFFGDNWSK